MSRGQSSVERVPIAQLDDVIDLFADAFSGYPVMRYTVGEAGDVAARERRLIRLFVTRRVARGGPMYAVSNQDKSAGYNFSGAMLLTLPAEPPPPADVEEISAAAWRELGDEARLRYEAYAASGRRFTIPEPHHHLNMIGVRGEHRGTGLGGRLLDAARALAEDDPGSAGVSLTTENPRNVTLYQHFGYEVVGHERIGPGLETWGMFLRIR